MKTSEKLTASDYYYQSLNFGYIFRDAEYSETNKEFTATQNLSDEKLKELIEAGKLEDEIVIRLATSSNASIDIKYAITSNTFTVPEGSNITADASGKTLYFNRNDIIGFEISHASALYFTEISARPTVALKRGNPGDPGDPVEKAIAALENIHDTSGRELILNNQANMQVFDAEETLLYDSNRIGSDTIYGDTRTSEITKEYVAHSTDPVNNRYLVYWTSRMSEVSQFMNGTLPVEQQSGTFYDLLPAGMDYYGGSLVVYADGAELNEGQYSMSIQSNYEKIGRALLEVKIDRPADTYQIEYGTSIDWETINLMRGSGATSSLHNAVTYVTGNDDIGSFSDEARGNQDENKRFSENDLKALGQHYSETKNKAIGAVANFDLTTVLSGTLGLHKLVRAADSDRTFSRSDVTRTNGEYVYRLSFGPNNGSIAKDLVLYDFLENFEGSQWRGTLKSVDASLAESLGVAPVIYYYTEPRENLPTNANTENVPKIEDAGSAWTMTAPEDLSTVTGIAIDFRKAKNGEDFILNGGQVIAAYVYMTAPAEAITDSETGEVIPDAIARNEIYLQQKQTSEQDTSFSEAGDSEIVANGPTMVTYRVVGDLEITKQDAAGNPIEGVSFRVTGTSAYGTVVDKSVTSGRNGTIIFRGLELTDEAHGAYELQEIASPVDYQLDDTIYLVKIDAAGRAMITGVKEEGGATRTASVYQIVDGESKLIAAPEGTELVEPQKEASAVYIVTNDNRIHGDLEFTKLGTVDGQEDAALLTGAVFVLTGESDYGNQIDLTAVAENGKVVFENIEKGTYTLLETEAAEGYILANRTFIVVCDDGGVVSIALNGEADEQNDNVILTVEKSGEGLVQDESYTITDEPLHGFGLWKVDASDKAQLAGAEFRMAGTSDYGTSYDLISQSQLNGSVSFAGLEPGTYVLQEATAPKQAIQVRDETSGEVTASYVMNYQLDPTVYKVVVGKDGLVTISWTDEDGAEHVMRNTVMQNVTVPDVETGETITETKQVVLTEGATELEDNSEVGTREFVPHYALFKMPNERAEDATLTIIKTWMDEDGNPITADTSGNPIPVVNVDIEVPEEPPKKAMISKELFNTFMTWNQNDGCAGGKNNVKTFQQWTGDAPFTEWAPKDNESTKNNVTDSSGRKWINVSMNRSAGNSDYNAYHDEFPGNVWFYYNSGNVYWYSDCQDVYLPKDCKNLFANLSNSSVSLDLSGLNTTQVEDASYMFYNCPNLTNVSGLTGFDSATNMSYMFAESFKNTTGVTLNLSHLYTGNVTDMSYMFQNCGTRTGSAWTPDNHKGLQAVNLAGLNTSKVTNMEYMFQNCYNLRSLDLSSFNTSSVTQMRNMFEFCVSVRSLTLPNTFTTSKVTNMHSMFRGMWYLTSLDLSSFDTHNVTEMWQMFNVNINMEKLYVGSGWSTDKVPNNSNTNNSSWQMLRNCQKLKGDNNTPVLIVANDDRIAGENNKTDKTYARAFVNNNPEYDPNNKTTWALFSYRESNPVSQSPVNTRSSYSAGDSSSSASSDDVYKKSVSILTNPNQEIKIDSNGAYYEKDGEKIYLYDQWIYDSTSQKWYYNFHVWNSEATYNVWEETGSDGLMSGWTWTNPANGWYTEMNYQPSKQNEVEIQNKKKKDTTPPDGGGSTPPTYGELLITKMMENTDATYADTEFSFVVTIGGTDHTFTLKPGETKTFSSIASGTSYTVKEKLPAGFDAPTPIAEGSAAETENIDDAEWLVYTIAQGSASGGAQVRVTVTNRPTDTKGSLQISKAAVAGEGVTDLDENARYAFTVELWTEETAATGEGMEPAVTRTPVTGIYGGLVFTADGDVGKANKQLKSGESFELTELPVGIHYRVTEPKYDNFTTVVKKNDIEAENGNNVSGVIAAGKTDTLAFMNTKTQNDPAGGFSLKKVLGNGTETDEKFNFTIYFSSLKASTAYAYTIGEIATPFYSSSEGSATVTLSLAKDQEAIFRSLPENAQYRIVETASNYLASYVITSNGSVAQSSDANKRTQTSLSTKMETVEEEEMASVIFTNTEPAKQVKIAKRDRKDSSFLPGAALQVTKITAEKGEDGKEILVASQDVTGFVSAASENILHNMTSGSYLLHEAAAPEHYMLARDVRFDLAENGTLSYWPVDTAAVDDVTTLTPVADVEKVTGTISTIAVEMLDDPYHIYVTKTDDQGTPLPGASLAIYRTSELALDTAEALASWTSDTQRTEITQVLELNTSYTLRELSAPKWHTLAEDIVFRLVSDDAEKTVRVQVLDGESWRDAASQDGVSENGSGSITITMVDGKPEIVPIQGTKVLENKELRENEFSFVLEPEGSAKTAWAAYPGLQGDLSLTAQNDANGKFIFTLAFSEADYKAAQAKGGIHFSEGNANFWYVLYEALPEDATETNGYAKDGIHYDSQKYLVRVEVSQSMEITQKYYLYPATQPVDLIPQSLQTNVAKSKR